MAISVKLDEPRFAVAPDRSELRRVAQARLSGASEESRACNPANLTVVPFSRVTYFDFEEAPLQRVRTAPAPVDDSDW